MKCSRKDELFSQIGDYISKVKAETGANAKTVEKKLKELDDTRKKLREAEQKVKEFRHKQNQSDAEVAQIRSYNESLRDDMEKLNSVVVAEKNLSSRQAQELSRWQESVMAMRSENNQLRNDSERADVLQQANEELNNELNNVR